MPCLGRLNVTWECPVNRELLTPSRHLEKDTIFPEICSDKAWKLTEIFYFYQIQTGIKIFNNKNCKVTFVFVYIRNITVTVCSHKRRAWTIAREYSRQSKRKIYICTFFLIIKLTSNGKGGVYLQSGYLQSNP